MPKFTFLEIHLDDADIDGTAQATADAVTALPFSTVTTGERDEADESDVEAVEIEDEDEETTISLAPLILILGLVVLAIILKKRLGSESEA